MVAMTRHINLANENDSKKIENVIIKSENDNLLNKNSKNIMVQHCVNAASTDFGSYNSKKQCDAADVVGR